MNVAVVSRAKDCIPGPFGPFEGGGRPHDDVRQGQRGAAAAAAAAAPAPGGAWRATAPVTTGAAR